MNLDWHCCEISCRCWAENAIWDQSYMRKLQGSTISIITQARVAHYYCETQTWSTRVDYSPTFGRNSKINKTHCTLQLTVCHHLLTLYHIVYLMFDHLFYPSLSPSTLIVHITHSSDLFRNNLVMCTQIETSVQCFTDTSQLTGMAIDLVTQIYTFHVGNDHRLRFSPLDKSFILSRGWKKYVMREPDIFSDPESAAWYNNAKYTYLHSE